MAIKQISVFLENRFGTLNQMTNTLSEGGIDLRALYVAETKDFGIARMIVDDVIAATNVLKDADFVAALTPVLMYEVPDDAGGLNALLKVFTEEQVNIEYMYASLGKSSAHAYMIFRVEDTEAVEAKLARRGLRPMKQEDIGKL